MVPEPQPAPNDAFSRVSAALLTVWPTVRDQTAGLSPEERSLVLDECGSDYRPLVDLLLDIGRQVRPTLAAFEGRRQTADAWANQRAPMVHRLVATRYLQPDVARWAVDVWGRVLGIAPAPAPPVVLTASGEPFGGGTAPRADNGETTRALANAARPVVVSSAHVPSPVRTVPAGSRGPASPRPGTKGSALSARGRVIARGPTPSGPRYQPAERRAAIVLVLLLVTITIAMSQALRGRQRDAAPVDADTSADRGAAATTAVHADSLSSTPLVAAESTMAPDLVAIHASADTATATVSAPSVSTVRMGDPTTMVGSVVDAGVGGRYTVTQRVRDVSGTENCEAVAAALAAGRESVEVVAHEPGTTRFELVTRKVTGTLASDGWFTANPRSGTTNNVNWQFRMRGRFGPDGFSAMSETYTEAILRWGRTQYCVVTADLTGRRLPG